MGVDECMMMILFTTMCLCVYLSACQAHSVLALECLMHASMLGLKTVFTDHSLFGFSDAAAIITNKILSDCSRRL